MGPVGDDVRDRLNTQIEDDAEKVGRRLLQGLTEMISEDPDALILNAVMARGARRLVDILDSLMTDGVAAVCTLRGRTVEERTDEFILAFTDQVSGAGGLIADAVVRHASVRCAERLLRDDSPAAHSIGDGTGDGRISGDLFCAVYALFFADAMSEFLTSIIVEKIKVVLPVLYLDPTDQVAKWIAEKILALIPDPCEQQEKSVDKARSLAEIARDLAPDSITDLLNA